MTTRHANSGSPFLSEMRLSLKTVNPEYDAYLQPSNPGCRRRIVPSLPFVLFAFATALLQGAVFHLAAQQAAPSPAAKFDSRNLDFACDNTATGSAYVPIDSWVYPAMWRLYAMGYAHNVYLGIRPWTRASIYQMLKETGAEIQDAEMYDDSTAEEARGIEVAVRRHLDSGDQGNCPTNKGQIKIESSYSVMRAIGGTPLQDSFHLGSTVINDYGRPFESGFNNYSGLSGYASVGRFLLYLRGEFQAAPSATGYSTTLAQALSIGDFVPFINPVTNLPYNQATIPLGPVLSTTTGRMIEAYASVHVLNHEISFGKQDDWLGPGLGGGMASSNNAENVYSFRINRVVPLYIPGLSKVLGPFRYEFLIGSLKGHVAPNDPWMHVEKISFKPASNLEFGFERTVIWGGRGHEPVTLHTFLRSFFSFDAVNSSTKFSREDPGARFGAFDFSYRLPLPRNSLTLYADMEAHDTVSPIFKPLHGTYRPGIYLSHVPGLPKLDLRVEAANTDSSHPSSLGGHYQYWEAVQVQGYTNKGQLFGDWIGREDKGGQAWLTYHLSGNEWIQVSARNQKASKDFIRGGTTLSDFTIQVVKRIGRDFEMNGSFTYEAYKAPIYLPDKQKVTNTSIQLTWFPNRNVSF